MVANQVGRAACAGTGAALVVGGSFLPWVRSGRRQRDSYSMLRVADHLGVLPHGWPTVAARGWFLMPLLAAGAGLALALDRSATSSVCALMVGVAAVVAVVLASRGPLPLRYGVAVSALGALVAVVTGGWSLWSSTRIRPRRTDLSHG